MVKQIAAPGATFDQLCANGSTKSIPDFSGWRIHQMVEQMVEMVVEFA
jgi:hypothetical protein